MEQARAQREQTRQFAALDTRVALNAARGSAGDVGGEPGTAEQAQRAYAIDEVRFREGISTQTDLSQSRLLLEQARANRAMAARNLAVARVRLALLRDLPIQQTGTGAVVGSERDGAAATTTAAAITTTNELRRRAHSTGAGGTTGSIQP